MGEYSKLILNTDGGARGNPGPAGAGGQIIDPSGAVVAEVSEYLGETTNNVAEYRALILTLERALDYAPSEIEIRADSELMVKQLRGEYKVKNEGLKPLHERVKQLLSGIKRITIKHVYRNENCQADELANKAIDSATKGERSDVSDCFAEGENDRKQADSFEQGSLF